MGQPQISSGPAKEVFKKIHGTRAERQNQFMTVNSLDNFEQYERMEKDERLAVVAQKVIHRHIRSANRSRSSSRKAEREVAQINDTVHLTGKISNELAQAENAIDDACFERAREEHINLDYAEI